MAESDQAVSGGPEAEELLERYCNLRHTWLVHGGTDEQIAGMRRLRMKILAALAPADPVASKQMRRDHEAMEELRSLSTAHVLDAQPTHHGKFAEWFKAYI